MINSFMASKWDKGLSSMVTKKRGWPGKTRENQGSGLEDFSRSIKVADPSKNM